MRNVRRERGCSAAWRAGALLAVLGAGLSIAALVDDPTLFAFGYLTAFVVAWNIAVGALFYVALHHLTHAVWSVVVRRAIEALAAALPVLALLFIPVLLLSGRIFLWMAPGFAQGDPLLAGKRLYLSWPFFVARTVVYFAVWAGYAFFFIRGSLKQDAMTSGPDEAKGQTLGEKDQPAQPAHQVHQVCPVHPVHPVQEVQPAHSVQPVRQTLRLRAASAPFMVLFAFTVTFASIDWMMSLEPGWHSTILGVYVYSGACISAMAAIILVVLWMRKAGLLDKETITPDHLYNLGGLLFAFTAFWGYIAMSQYLLIWYANLPEETVWYARRVHGEWGWVALALIFVRFAVPFLVLLSRRAKTHAPTLAWVSALSLAGQLIDTQWMIMPEARTAKGFEMGGVFPWHETGPLILMAGVFLLIVGWFFGKYQPVARGDPLFEESKRFRL